MKGKLFILVMILLAQATYAQQNLKLKETIDSLYSVDQQVQWDLKSLMERKASKDSILLQEQLKKQTFNRHISIIKDIYQQYGYPTIKLVGKESSTHFFALIQHADNEPSFQASMLPVLKKLSKKGAITKKDYAYLYDRVQRNTGGKQLYGTQLTYSKSGNLFDEENKIIYPPDLADPKNVDKRRKEMGLEPLEKYYEGVLELLGRPRKK